MERCRIIRTLHLPADSEPFAFVARSHLDRYSVLDIVVEDGHASLGALLRHLPLRDGSPQFVPRPQPCWARLAGTPVVSNLFGFSQ